jgi:hypothetical protein
MLMHVQVFEVVVATSAAAFGADLVVVEAWVSAPASPLA